MSSGMITTREGVQIVQPGTEVGWCGIQDVHDEKARAQQGWW